MTNNPSSEHDSENFIPVTTCPLSEENSCNGDSHDRDGGADTSRRLLFETCFPPPCERRNGEYSFVNESGVLQPVVREAISTGAALAATSTDVAAETQEVTATMQFMALEGETCGNERSTTNADVVEESIEQPPTVVSAERLSDMNDFTETATVVQTFDDSSDDAVIRKILQEDLIASGRSTDELQEYIRTASLENVASRMNIAIEEEKTEIVEPDSALAWALHEQELSRSNLSSTHDHNSAVATLPDKRATVVRITEHDVHPAELEDSDARAELIGEDYSLNYAMYSDNETPSAAAFATFGAVEEEATTEVTVLDSKPAATANLWSVETTEEATVLETKPPADETWSRIDEDVEEVTVDAVVEEVASVVEITEDVHPAGFEEDDVEATLIGREYTNSVTVHDQEVNAMTEEDAVVDIIRNDAHVTLVGNASSRVVSYTYSSPPAQRPLAAARAMSDPPRPSVFSPVDSVTFDSFYGGIAALDDMEQQAWMNRPSSFVAGDSYLLPPPDSPVVTTPMAAAQLMDDRAESDTCSDVPPLPPRISVAGTDRETPRTSSARTEESERSSATSGSGRRAAASLQLLSTAAVRGTSSVMRSTTSLMDVLFGETRQPQHGFDLDAATGSILPRTLLPWSVFPNASGMWVATVNTNQKALDSNNVREASKALRAFSCATQKQAEALARAWAPPRMLPFSDNPLCFICESKFAVLKRACHCRNCGVCVCSNCIVQWPSKMLPVTYNIKNESLMNVCKSCDWLCSTFRLALLNGHHDQAVALHATGNVNLVTPFANVKGELFYPVHCAVLGGSLSLLKWLVDEHCCPLRSLRVGGRRQSRGTYTPILTSRGRSLLGIAMENRNLEIVRYLVADENMSLTEEKNLTIETMIQTLEAALRKLPSEPDGSIPQPETNGSSTNFVPTQIPSEEMAPASNTVSYSVSPQEVSPSSLSGSGRSATRRADATRDDETTGSVEDACIICYANTIDTVVTPCGHQICCMQCSTHITRCPVCSVNCSFMRVYKP